MVPRFHLLLPPATPFARPRCPRCGRKVAAVDLDPEGPVMDLLMADLDPEGYGDLTLPGLKANWLPEWREAAAVKPKWKENSQSMHYSKRFLQHPSVQQKTGQSLADAGAAKAPRSTGGWGNRMARRRAQDEWQPSLLLDNKVGWGAEGYRAYEPTALDIKVPGSCAVGVARGRSIALPPDRGEALDAVKSGVVATLKRLKMNPTILFNTLNLEVWLCFLVKSYGTCTILFETVLTSRT